MTRLNEYDKTEWQDIAKKMVPGLLNEQYDEMWLNFLQARADWLAKAEQH